MFVYSQASLIKDIFPGGNSNPRELTNVNGILFFVADDGTHGVELWKSDGTEAGTILAADIIPGNDSSFPNWLENIGLTLYFRANDGVHGTELWKYEPALTCDPPVLGNITAPADPVKVGKKIKVKTPFSDETLSSVAWDWRMATLLQGILMKVRALLQAAIPMRCLDCIRLPSP